jgi:amino acid permease
MMFLTFIFSLLFSFILGFFIILIIYLRIKYIKKKEYINYLKKIKMEEGRKKLEENKKNKSKKSWLIR